MDKHGFRSFFDDGLFVVLIMAAAMASAAMEASAVLGALPKADAKQVATMGRAAPAPAPAEPQLAGAASVDGAVLSAAAQRAAHSAER